MAGKLRYPEVMMLRLAHGELERLDEMRMPGETRGEIGRAAITHFISTYPFRASRGLAPREASDE